MPQVAGRRAHQFGYFVLHLKFAAIHFEHILGAPVQHFGQRFHGSRLSRTSWSQQKENSDGPSFRRKAGLEHLHIRHDLANRGRLAHNLSGQQTRQAIRPRLCDRFHPPPCPSHRQFIQIHLVPPFLQKS